MNKILPLAAGLLFFISASLTAQIKTISVKTVVALDDVEETKSSGSINSSSSSLQLGDITQMVGVRFPNVNIPIGATVTKAYLQFSTRYANTQNATINIVAQKGSAAAFTSTARTVSSRSYTSAQVTWVTQAWTVANERTLKQRTSDISIIVNEALANGWTGSGALAFKMWSDIAGGATPTSHSGTVANNPELVIEYVEKPIERKALSGVFINEVAGSGSITLKNDWIEVYNSNTTPVNLDSVFLSDSKSKPYKFMFKKVVLPAKGFIVIEADDLLAVSTSTKAAFGISGSGEKIYLSQVLNGNFAQLDSVDVPVSQYNTSFGRQPDGSSTLVAFNTPTPSVSNSTARQLLDIQFSKSRGLYTSGFSLILTAPAGATIRYTTNSSVPTTTTGTIYTGPIAITNNAVIKAIAYNATGESKVVTNTYIINSNIAYKEIPIVVISTTNSTGTTSENKCTFEYINKSGENLSAFADAGFRVFGNASVGLAKKNYRLNFRSEYGYKKFKHSIFDKRVEENYEPTDEFNSFDLKSGFDATNDYGLGGTLLSDNIAHSYMRQMGNKNVHTRYVHVFLNGSYNGVYILREQFTTSYMESYFGGDKANYDNIDGTNVISSWTGSPSITDGNNIQLNELKTYARTNFQEIKKRVDMKHFIDFMMLFFIGDYEWEYRASAEHGYKNAKWIFHHNDFDGFIRENANSGLSNYTGKLGTSGGRGPLDLFYLAGFGGSNLEYKTMVKDRTRVLFDENSPNGVLSANNMRRKTEEARDQYRKFNSLEYGRWAYTNSTQFERRVKGYIDYIPTRVQTVKNFLNQNGLMHTLKPVVMSHVAGKVAASERVTISNPNAGTTVYYSLNGDDVVFDNAVASWAKVYTLGQALPLKEGKNTLKVRAYTNGNFGPLTEITYIVAPAVNITGVNYNPVAASGSEADKLEFLLVTNYGSEARSVGGDSITAAISFVFPAGTVLNPGETVMITKDLTKYPNVNYRKFVWTSGKLANEGEKVVYKTAANEIINEFTYLPTTPWPTSANAGGDYLKLKSANLDNSKPENWAAASLTTLTVAQNLSSQTPTMKAYSLKEGSKAIISSVITHTAQVNYVEIEKFNSESQKFEWVKTIEKQELSSGYFTYTDYNPSVTEDNIYRLALYRYNNQTPQYSDIMTLDFSHLIDYTVYPNPSTDYAEIQINQTKLEFATVRLVNLYGQAVLQQQVTNVTAPIHLDLGSVPAGQYILFIDIKGKRSISKKLNISK